ncbi:hypothetical protein Rhom172_2282 [Rhodothermus marinus SG0.5JP17-172]|jgi:hypothetical protein|uniref:hypothetical protein n=1 Tax=Rhodothermus marinus TaxID=29549 RepID=UPI000223DC03|nr:hypothetical protein [Rhodothermus marinus]AEN74178.1 hypothetical protein Rhom172_2282 [Rhodothermus marinus SG0.5JP17-172]MBO2490845.1 hypothetical protein [Rhodothermus marinus]
MPPASYWLVRLALVHLLLGFTTGAWLLVHKAGWLPALPGLLTVHVELVLLGFMVLFAVAVAWWILPRTRGERPPDRGAWTAGGLLAMGVWLVVVGAMGAVREVQTAGRLLELLAVAGWARLLWPRILIATRHHRAS